MSNEMSIAEEKDPEGAAHNKYGKYNKYDKYDTSTTSTTQVRQVRHKYDKYDTRTTQVRHKNDASTTQVRYKYDTSTKSTIQVRHKHNKYDTITTSTTQVRQERQERHKYDKGTIQVRHNTTQVRQKYNTSTTSTTQVRQVRHKYDKYDKYDTITTSTTQLRLVRHKYDTSTTQVRHKYDTSTIQVRHKYDTSTTQIRYKYDTITTRNGGGLKILNIRSSSRTSPRSVARTSPQQLDQTSPQQTPLPSAPGTSAAVQRAAQQAAQLEPYLERIARLEERVEILEQEITNIKQDHSAGGKWQFPRPTMHEYFRDVKNETYRIVTGYGVNPETEERWLENNPIYRVFISEYIYTMYPTAQVNFVGAVNKEKISHHARNVLYYRTALYMLRYLPNSLRIYNWHNYTNKITTVLCNPPLRDPDEPLLTGNF
nr:uncharacterized protein LOC115260682 [Aedes albopictus]